MHLTSSTSFVRISAVFILCLLSGACGGSDDQGQVVTWPELVRFDELAYRADGLARTEDFDALVSSCGELHLVGKALTAESIPANVSDPRQVEASLGDLTSLIDGISEEPDVETLSTLVMGMHPVIEELMKAAGMPHVHANEGPNGGFRFPVFDTEGAQVGIAELKLHDDAGDVEVWLSRGGHGGEAWQLPVDTTLELAFAAQERTIALAVRDSERNENEAGEPTIVDGKTDYFVFPADTGADASWLMGADFAAKAELRVVGTTTGAFVLRPHVH